MQLLKNTQQKVRLAFQKEVLSQGKIKMVEEQPKWKRNRYKKRLRDSLLAESEGQAFSSQEISAALCATFLPALTWELPASQGSSKQSWILGFLGLLL